MSNQLPTPPNPPVSGAPSGPLNHVAVPERLGAMFREILPVAVIAGVYFWSFGWAAEGNSDESVSFEEFIGMMIEALLIGAIILGGVAFWLIVSLKKWSKSTTVGKRDGEMLVVSMKTGAPASMGQMLARELIGKWGILMVGVLAVGGLVEGRLGETGDPYLLGWVTISVVVIYFSASLVLIVAAPIHQGAWDYLAGTTVVRAG